MKPSHIVIGLLVAIVVVGGIYIATRPATVIAGGAGGGPMTGEDQTARDVSTVLTGGGAGLGALLSGIADLVRAGRTPAPGAAADAERSAGAAT